MNRNLEIELPQKELPVPAFTPEKIFCVTADSTTVTQYHSKFEPLNNVRYRYSIIVHYVIINRAFCSVRKV
jgi:hypothetical protein